MATTQNTRDLRGHETLLSKRVFFGNTRPQFHSGPARWSHENAGEPRLAFDVTWAGPTPSENAFDGYRVLVTLGKEHLDGDLVLLIRPELEDLALALVDGVAFVDACSKEPIATGAKVLGRVVAEQQFLSDQQLFEKAKAFKRAEFAGYANIQHERECKQAIVDRIDSGIDKAQHELVEAVAGVLTRPSDRDETTIFWQFEHALKDSRAYKQLRDKFREADAEVHADPQLEWGDGNVSDCDLDGPLKELISLAFRAGQYAGPEQFMLDPEPSDWETVERLIADSLVRSGSEGDTEVYLTETVPLAAIIICSSLIDMPAYHDERDRFRRSDVEEKRWPGKVTEDMDNSLYDFALRSLLGRWFRAGMLAARTLQAPAGETARQETSDTSLEVDQ